MKKIKVIIKKILVAHLVFLMLLPTLFSGIAYAKNSEEITYINTERAGNYAASFAINFYENWSSKGYVETGKVTSSSATINSSQSFVWPLAEGSYSITSEFGPRSLDNHKGMDFGAEKGTPVYSSCNGVVVETFNGCTHNYGKTVNCGCGGSYGNNVKIDAGDGIGIIYGHLTGVNVNVGDTVTQGQQIGTVGSTGWSTGFHLHFEFVTNDIVGLTPQQYIDRGSNTIMGYRYSVNPRCFVEDGATITAKTATSSAKYQERGEIKTAYNETANPYQLVDPAAEVYEFSNISWINFVYRESVLTDSKFDNQSGVLTGTGDAIKINGDNFDDEENIEELNVSAGTSRIIDASELISEGKILPGDILLVNKGNGETEYLFYVGGARVIYATGDATEFPSGALKYEYIEYYFRRIRNKLRKGHEDDENFVLPKFGVTKIYRIKQSVAEGITEAETNMFFNGKGYFTVSDYDGLASTVQISVKRTNPIKWLFSKLKQLIDFLINLITYAIRMQIIGWANLFENLIQHIVLGASGDNKNVATSGFFGTNATSASGDRITVESIFFNKIPIIDANFFNFETAGGMSLMVDKVDSTTGKTTKVPDETNVVYMLRKNLRTIYVIMRNLSIAIMLFVLVFVGIRIAMESSSPEKKAAYKKMLNSWFVGLIAVLFIHLFMYMIFQLNDTFVSICEKFGTTVAQAAANTSDEVNLYDAVRTKAYAFNWKEGVPATIIYVFMVYLMVRFLLIYVKRYITIYILAISGTFMGIKYAIDNALGKKSKALNKWGKDFAFNVLLQTVHVFIYTLFMGVALSVSQESLGGALLCFIILNFMLKADSIIVKIFGLDQAGSLAEVNNPESWRQVLHKYAPIVTTYKGAATLFSKVFTGKDGIITKYKLYMTGEDSIRDAQKKLEQQKYQKIGDRARRLAALGEKIQSMKGVGAVARAINRTPIRNLWKYNEYKRMLGKDQATGKDLGADTNKRLYKAISNAKKLDHAKFTRRLAMTKDLLVGTFGMAAAIPLTIANPEAGALAFMGAKKKISQYTKPSKHKVYYSGTVSKARDARNNAKTSYYNNLDIHTNNEVAFQEEYNRLLDRYNNASTADQGAIRDQLRTMLAERRVERSKELHQLELDYEELNEAKIKLANAKHEKNSGVGKVVKNTARTLGMFTGATQILDAAENITTTDTNQSYDDVDKKQKAHDKLKDIKEIVKLENDVRELNKQIKEKYKTDGVLDEEKFEKDMNKTVTASERYNVTSNMITKAINETVYETSQNRITEENIDMVLDKVQGKLSRRRNGAEITDEVRNKVREALEKKMLEDNKGLGLDAKDATKEIRKAMGSDSVLHNNSELAISDPQTKALHEELLKKIEKINTLNELAKVKYKSSLVNINKILKDAKKL